MTDSPTLQGRPLPQFAEFVTMMATLMALTALSIDVMLPALPHIHDEFGLLDPNRVQLVVTSYIAGFAFGQLFNGPLSDWLGRKPVLIAGLVAYAFASFGCLLSGSFEMLLAMRVLQGIASAAPRTITVAVVRDVYGGRRMAEVMSFVMAIFIIVPVVAPSLGGAFLLVGSWHLIFGFLGFAELATAVWMMMRLPETRDAARVGTVSFGWVGRAYLEALRNRRTLGYTLATGAVYSALMGYINSAQQVFAGVFGLKELFPLAFGSVALAVAAASLLNGRIVERLGMHKISHFALLSFIAVGIVHLAVILVIGTPPFWLFMPLLALTLFFFGLMMPNFSAMAMEPMGRIAGTASSFTGAVMTGIGALGGYLIGRFFDGTVLPLVAGFTICGLLALVMVLVTERGRLFRVSGR